MSTPVIVWIAIIGLFITVVIVRFTVAIIKYCHEGHSLRIFSTGTEREEFFIPGDSLHDDDEDWMYDED